MTFSRSSKPNNKFSTSSKTIVWSFIFGLISSPFFALADSTTSTFETLTPANISITQNASSTAGSVLGLKTPLIPPIIGQIKEAKIKLSAITLNHALVPVYKSVKDKKTGKTAKIISKYNLGDKDIALAILDPETKNITATVGRLQGKTMVFEDPAVDVKLTRFNGVNSQFQINRPADGVVIALKYLISKTESGSKKTIERDLSEAVYVPYSDDVKSPDVIVYGGNYLNNLINNVTLQLQNIPSQSIPGKDITEAIPPAMIKALIYAEHTDTATVLYGDNTQNTIDQLNILLALNEGDAYKYSVSNAGARGIAQFIPSTYQALVKRHPEAGLTTDFVAGMSDHLNAIKAMYLLLDDYAGTVRVKATDGFVESRVFDYGAASYNGGTARVTKAVNLYGNRWNEDRSDQINATQGIINSLNPQIKSLKSKVKNATYKKTKATLQAQLSAAQSRLATAKSELAALKAATLKNETINYLLKIYKVIQYFNDQQV